MNEIEPYEFLYSAILNIQSKDECENFFSDLCTPQELKTLSQRLLVAKNLYSGSNYKDISENTGASTAIISRVKKCLFNGAGGLITIFKKMEL